MQTICTDSDNDGNCDFDEPTGCVGEFNAPVISMSGMVETAADIAEWATTDFLTGASDDTGMEGTSFTDYAGRLNDGRYSVTRVYVATDICGNTSEAGQLIVADASHAAGCAQIQMQRAMMQMQSMTTDLVTIRQHAWVT